MAGRRRQRLEKQSNADLIAYRKAHNRFNDTRESLCESNQNIAKDDKGNRTYKCTLCNTFKPLDDFNEFQRLKFFGMTCAACQSRPTRLNDID